MVIREALDSDVAEVVAVERAAFGEDEEAELVRDLLVDATAQPLLSLLAFQGTRAVGHILFTRAYLEPDAPLSISLLAPLAVVPAFQRRGIGGALIQHGLHLLTRSDVDLVFVLGHPGYYPRHGFQPAVRHGFVTPYPILEKNADAWMVHALRPGVIDTYKGTVICADALNKPHYWQE